METSILYRNIQASPNFDLEAITKLQTKGYFQPLLLRLALLCAARGALVLLDVFRLGRGYFHAFPMEPLLANVTAYPELISTVISPTAPTKGFTMLIFILLVALIVELQTAF